MDTSTEEANIALTSSLLEGQQEEEQQQPLSDLEQAAAAQQDHNANWTVGEKQNAKCRDGVWAGVFVLHVIAIVIIAIMWGIPALSFAAPSDNNDEPQITVHVGGVLYLCLLAGLASLVISGLALGVMIRHSQILVQISVLFSMFSTLVMVVLSAYSGNDAGALIFFVMFLLGCCYAWRVWNRIPFAAANLSTAVTAIRTNLGIALVAYGMVLVVYAWTTLWLLSFVGVYVKLQHCDSEGTCESHLSGWVIVLYLLSYFWTQQVICNVIHVTVAGVVGTWWIVPIEASSCCSPSILDSFLRSVTYSFGSICVGSLLVAVLQTLHQLVIQLRRDNEDNILYCLLECIISILESVMEYFNRWAFVYVGLYGYPYMDAGKRVMTLFQARGWTAILNDDLVSTTLALMNMVIAALAGFVGMAILAIEPSWLSLFEDQASSVAFVTSFLIGMVIASTLMSVIQSGVETVVVCFAETPAEFSANHPELSEKMVEAWLATYPEEYRQYW